MTYSAIRRVSPEQAPESVAADCTVVLEDLKERLERIAARGSNPVVFAGEVDLASALHGVNAGLQLLGVDWVEMIRVHVHLLDAEMRLVDPIRAVKYQFLRRETLHVLCDVLQPVGWAVHVPPDRPQQLITRLVREYRRVFCVGEMVVLVFVRQERLYVALESRDDSGVRVELLDLRIVAVRRLGEVETGPAQEVVLPTVVIVLFTNQYSWLPMSEREALT